MHTPLSHPRGFSSICSRTQSADVGLAAAEGGDHDTVDVEALFAFDPCDGSASSAFSKIRPSHCDVGLNVGDREPRGGCKEFSVTVDPTDGDTAPTILFLIPRDHRAKRCGLKGGGAAAFVADGLSCSDGAALSVKALCIEGARWATVEICPEQEIAVVVTCKGWVCGGDTSVGDIEESVGGFALVVEESEFEFSSGGDPRDSDLVSAERHRGEGRVLGKESIFGLDGCELALGFEVGIKELKAHIAVGFVDIADPANAQQARAVSDTCVGGASALFEQQRAAQSSTVGVEGSDVRIGDIAAA